MQALDVIKSTRGEHVDVSVIMPAHNEAQKIDSAIRRTIQALQATAGSYELIVADDGSTDGTYQKVSAFSEEDDCVKVVRNGRNTGKGTAVKHASNFARGDTVVVMDADMEIDPDKFLRYLQVLDNFDLCIGSKRHPKAKYDAPLSRKFLSLSFSALVRLLTGIRFPDTQTGMKAFRGPTLKAVIKYVLVKRYAFDVEILSVANLLGLKVVEVPVDVVQGRRFRARGVLYMFVDLLGIAYRLRIIKWYQKSLKSVDPRYMPVLDL